MTQAEHITQELRANLRQQGAAWVGHCHVGNRSDVEIEVAGDSDGPSEHHVKSATECVARLAGLLPEMVAVLNAVEEGYPLFPPRQSRRWYLEGLSFIASDSRCGKAFFTLDEPGYEYIYVLYSVGIVDGHVGEVHADTR